MSQINITLEEFISQYQNIVGYGTDSQCAIDIINRARYIAYPMGDWVGTMVYQGIQINNGNFILPYNLEVIRSAKSCNRSITINSLISKEEFDSCGYDVMARIEGRGFLPFQLTDNYPLSFYAVNKKDFGKIVRVSYIDSAGSMRDEEVSLLYGSTEMTALSYIPKQILRISKEGTVGFVAVHQASMTGVIHPEDKNPQYTIYCVDMCRAGCVAVHAKKKCIPYSLDDLNSVLDINPEPLSSLIIALKSKDSRGPNWITEYSASVDLAKNFLKVELVNEQSTIRGLQPVNYNDTWADSIQQP